MHSVGVWRIVKWGLAWGLAGGILWGGYVYLLPWVYYKVDRLWRGEPETVRFLGLADYRVTLDGLEVAGLSDNLSGLTFNPHTGTLFTVINRPAQVAELDTRGRLLRVMPLHGVKDPEGITHVQEDLYVVADEAENRLHWVRIQAGQAEVSATLGPSLALGLSQARNLGFEGVSWDGATGRLFVVQEKRPRRVLVVSGLDAGGRLAEAHVSIHEWGLPSASRLLMKDFSSLTIHEPTGNLLLLSDESAVLVEHAPDGTRLSRLPLWRGHHGLKRGIPQAEGVALGSDGALYVISEPNLFYRFEKSASWGLKIQSGDGGAGPAAVQR